MKAAFKGNREEILHGSLPKVILSIAIPVVINSFLQTMYNLTDTYWLGQLGNAELAAINLVTPMQNIIINIGSGVTVAGAVLISQYIGAGQDEEACGMANQVFACALLFALVCASLCAMLTPSIVAWLGADGLTYRYGVTYLRLVMLDMPFLFTINIYQAVHQAQGDTLRPMLLNLGGIVLNMLLDPLLMAVLHFGVAGAALATVAAKMIPACIALYLLTCPKDTIRLSLRRMRFQKEKLKAIVKIGLPTAIGGSTMQLGFLLMSRNVYVYGVEAMAAYGIGNKINGLISLPSNGIGSAVATIVGQNMGAEQPERAWKGYRMSMLGVMAFLFVGGFILSRPAVSRGIVGIFTADQRVVAMAAEFLSLMAFWCWTNSIYNCTTGLFQGTGHTAINMAVDITRLWGFRFATLYVCENLLHLGVSSIWYSVVVSNGLSSLILLILSLTGIWKKNRVKINGTPAEIAK